MRIKLSMYLHFYLVYLLLNGCNGNNGTPATWSRASLTHLHAYNKTWSRKLLVIGKSGYMHVWRHKSSFWTSAKIKPAPFRANNSLTRKTRCVLRHFCCSYLKANKLQLANIGAFFWDTVYINNKTRGQSNLTKSASRGAHSPVRGHPRGSKVVPLNSWGRVSY